MKWLNHVAQSVALILLIATSVAPLSAKKSSLGSSRDSVAVTSATKVFLPGWRGELQRVAAAHRGVMGIAVKNLDTGEAFSINGDEIFPTASTIKAAIMCTTFDEMAKPDGKFPDYYMTMVYDGSTSSGGAGFIRQFKLGTPVELKELLHFMITVSDNTATRMLIKWLGGPERVNSWLDSKGFKCTRLMPPPTFAPRPGDKPTDWGLGSCTPNEMARLFEMIARGEAGCTTATDEMLRLLGHQYFDDGIASQAPPTVWMGSKSGAINRSRSDNAIVASPGGMYVLSVYTKDNADERWTKENEAEHAIRAIARIVWKHFNPRSKYERPAGAERL